MKTTIKITVPKKAPRNYVYLAMVLSPKATKMRDRREGRGGSKNRQREYLSQE